MKLHSDVLRKADVREAARVAREHGYDIQVGELVRVGSRQRTSGLQFYCEAIYGKRACNGRPGYAASWAAWGWLIAELFRRDPEAVIGWYKSPAHFSEVCREECERVTQYRPQDKDRQDISFIDYMEEEVTV